MMLGRVHLIMQSLKIRQGDIVYGHKVGGKRGINLILGLFGRTKDTKLGDNRFDAKTGYTDEVTEPDGEVSTSGETNEPDGQEPPVQLPKTKATQAHRAAAGGPSIGIKLTMLNLLS